MQRGMVSGGVGADTKGLLSSGKVAVENNYALNPAVHLGGANVRNSLLHHVSCACNTWIRPLTVFPSDL